MAVKFGPKYTMQKKLNISLTIRTFAILGVSKIDFQSLVQNGIGAVWIKNSTRNSFKSVLSKFLWVMQWKYFKLWKMT